MLYITISPWKSGLSQAYTAILALQRCQIWPESTIEKAADLLVDRLCLITTREPAVKRGILALSQ